MRENEKNKKKEREKIRKKVMKRKNTMGWKREIY